MPELLQIPLNVGATEHTDPKLFPAGALKRVENLRLRKNNRLGKRGGYILTSFQDYDDAEPLAGEQLRGMSEVDGAGRIVAGRAVYDYEPVTGRIRALDGVISDYGGVFEESIYHDEQRQQRFPDLVAVGSYWVVSWTSYASGGTNGSLYVAWLSKATRQVVRLDHVADEVEWSRLAATSANNAAVFWINEDDDVMGALVDTDGVGTPVTLAAADAAASLNFDVAAGTASFCLAYHTDDSTIEVLFLGAGLTTTDSQTIARSGNPGVVADIADGKYYVLDNTAADVRCTVYNVVGGAAVATADLDTAAEADGQPTGVLVTTGGIRAVWSGESANGNPWIKARDVSAAGVLQATVTTYGTKLASKPWVHGGTVRAWTFPTDAGASGLDQTRIYAEKRVDSATLGAYGAIAGRGIAAEQSGSHLPGAAGGVTLLPTFIRGGLGGETMLLVVPLDGSAETAPWVVPAATWQGVTYYAGGVLSQSDRVAAHLTGFLVPPAITGRTDTAGALTGDYSWSAIWERTDSSGKVHRSEPATVNGPATLATERATLAFGPYALDNWSSAAPAGGAVLRVYRTLDGEPVFHESTDAFGAPSAVAGTVDATLTYEDNETDANIEGNPVLYTQVGNSLPHAAPPSAKFLAYHNDRIWIARPGGILHASKKLVEGEPPQWADDPVFEVRLPGDCTALAALDSALIAFTSDAVFAVGGEGPDDAGEGFFLEPQRIPSDGGCQAPESILSTAQGVLGAVAVAAEGIYFRSQRGIYLLPRGGGAPAWVGETVRDQTDARPYVGGAMVVPEQSLVVFVINSAQNFVDGTSRVLNYDYRVGQWFVDTTPGNALAWCAQMHGARFWSFDGAELYTNQGASFADNDGTADSYIASTLETGDMTPFGPMGWGRVSKVVLLGEYRGDCTLSLELSYDGGQTWDTPVTWNLRAADGLTAGDEIRREHVPARWKTEKLRARISDAELAGGNPSEGFVYNALALQVEATRGAVRQPSANRR